MPISPLQNNGLFGFKGLSMCHCLTTGKVLLLVQVGSNQKLPKSVQAHPTERWETHLYDCLYKLGVLSVVCGVPILRALLFGVYMTISGVALL